MDNWSRRRFLETGLVSVAAIRLTSPILEKNVAPDQDNNNDKIPLQPREIKLLTLVMDEIVPAGDGMPTASEAGCEQYLAELAAHDGTVARELKMTLQKLNRTSQKLHQQSFEHLPSQSWTPTLKEFEQREPEAMKTLRNCVYEAYYMQPRVRELIGYEAHPTNQAGPKLTFDESLLAKVRIKPKHYREV